MGNPDFQSLDKGVHASQHFFYHEQVLLHLRPEFSQRYRLKHLIFHSQKI
jgi:hypothetical protein